MLSDPASSAIDSSDEIGVSTVSCWELGMLAGKDRIRFEYGVQTWIRRALAVERVVALPLSRQDAVDAGLLDRGVGADPADRMIYATARNRGAELITRDARLRGYDPRGTIW